MIASNLLRVLEQLGPTGTLAISSNGPTYNVSIFKDEKPLVKLNGVMLNTALEMALLAATGQLDENFRQCTRCKAWRLASQYVRNRTGIGIRGGKTPGYRQAWYCMECRREMEKRYYVLRRAKLKRAHALGANQANELP